MNSLVIPAAIVIFLAGAPYAIEPASLRTIEEVHAELERLKAEDAPPATVQAQLEAYEEWRRSPWRGGRFGVDPMPVQKLTTLDQLSQPYEK